MVFRGTGDWDELLTKDLFPIPLPASEAGPSLVPYTAPGVSGNCQRRYLVRRRVSSLCMSGITAFVSSVFKIANDLGCEAASLAVLRDDLRVVPL